MKNYFNKLDTFDPLTSIRLKNLVLVSFGLSLVSPVIISLKGLYLAPYLISLLLILTTLAVKANNYMVNRFSIKDIYVMGIYTHALFILTYSTYFIFPHYMIYFVSFLEIVEVIIFSSFSIKLNTFLTDNYPDSMNRFQVVRNSIRADAVIAGLIVSAILNYINVSLVIGLFIFYNIIFSIWLIKNLGIIKEYS